MQRSMRVDKGSFFLRLISGINPFGRPFTVTKQSTSSLLSWREHAANGSSASCARVFQALVSDLDRKIVVTCSSSPDLTSCEGKGCCNRFFFFFLHNLLNTPAVSSINLGSILNLCKMRGTPAARSPYGCCQGEDQQPNVMRRFCEHNNGGVKLTHDVRENSYVARSVCAFFFANFCP